MTIGELIVSLGFKPETVKLRDFIHDLGDLNLSSIIAATGLGAVLESIKGIMSAADGTARSFNNFGALTGQSTQELQKWEKVAQQSGLAAGIMASTVNTLQNNIQGLQITGEGANAYGMLHLDPRQFKDDFSLLQAIMDRIKDMPIAMQKWYLTHLGLNEQLVMMIPHLQDINNQLVNSPQELERMRDYQKDITKLTGDWQTLLVTIASILEPIIGNFVRGFEVIIQTLEALHLMVPVMIALATWAGVLAFAMNPVGTILGLLAGGGLAALGAFGHKEDLLTPASSNAFSNDYSKSITMHNAITINGDDPHKIAKVLDDYHHGKINEAEGQSYLQNY